QRDGLRGTLKNALDGFPDIGQQLFAGIPFREATRKRRDLRPKATFLRVVNDYFDFHAGIRKKLNTCGDLDGLGEKENYRRLCPSPCSFSHVARKDHLGL